MAEYVERGALLDALGYDATKSMWVQPESTFGIILSAPAADVAPVRHGRWIECDYLEPCIYGFGTIRRKNKGLKCNQCVHVFEAKSLWMQNFCPNCGALMDGGST